MDYIALNKKFWLAHSIAFFNTNEIALYMYLLEQYRIATEAGCKDAFFYQSSKKITAELSISFNTYNKARLRLKEFGVIDFVSVAGATLTKYSLEVTFEETFSNFDKVTDKEVDKETEKVKEETPPTPPKEENNIQETPLLSGESKTPQERKNFVAPTIEQITEFVREKGLNVDAERFFYYYEANGWTCGKGQKMKSWQAACHNWHTAEKHRKAASGAQGIIHKQTTTQYENF